MPNSFDLLSDAEIVAPNSFDLLSDAVIVPPNDFELFSDALILPASAFALTSDAVVGLMVNSLTLTSDALISEFNHVEPPNDTPPEFPQAEVVNPFACAKAINQCLPCNDDPVSNISAEDADVDRYIGVVPEYPDQPITGDPTQIFFAVGCLGLCYSTVSQEEANQCASNQAIECVGDSPGGVGNPRGIFSSDAQTCSVNCTGGGTFTYSLVSGAVLSFYSTADANARAKALACKLAKLYKICLTIIGSTTVCKDDYASFVIKATGALTQFPLTSSWSVSGPAIDPNLFSYDTSDAAVFGTNQIRIEGTPTVAGDTYVIVRITDNNTGFYAERQIPITVNNCSVDWGNITPDILSSTRSEWDSGSDIPAGTYRIAYVNGAWRPGASDLWVVGDGGGTPARGYVIEFNGGDDVVDFPTSGIYGSQAEAEAGTGGLSKLITHVGGTIGMHLRDLPYSDNGAGSPNPTFKLETV